jgi:hypothetical protein
MSKALVSQCLARALEVVVPALDIAAGRPQGPEPPAFCESRGYTEFLASLSDEELSRCEAEGLAARLPALENAPSSLVDLGRQLLDVARLPAQFHPSNPHRLGKQRLVSERKQNEIEALLAIVAPLAARSDRIVDVGAGRGHFTRIAAEIFDRDAVGIEREPERVTTAARLSLGTRASFLLLDASREPLVLRTHDLAIGLHACGALGDRLISAAAEARCNVVLVSCCLQKIDGPVRMPSSIPARAAGLVLSREMLGLSNLTSRMQGVESTLGETMDARRKRYALARLLRHRGIDVEPGEEMRGINRRSAHRLFAELVHKALLHRGLAPASSREIDEHDREGTIEFGKIRRFSLPRSMVARALEVAVAFDRAALLEQQGYEAQVVEVFDMDVTPRNLATIGAAAWRTPT